MAINGKTIENLGSAVDLIDNIQYAPMFRNRQKNYKELFDFSEQLARKKKNPSKYFAKIWGTKQLKKTIDWLTKLVNQAKSKAAVEYHQLQESKRRKLPVKTAGRDKYEQLKHSYGLQ